MKHQKYASLRGNQNRAGKTKPEAEKKSSVLAVPMTSAEKGLLVAAANGAKLADVYRPVLIKHAQRILKKTTG
jgi:hypothetical protein